MKICETCSRSFVRPKGSKVRDCGTHRRAEFADADEWAEAGEAGKRSVAVCEEDRKVVAEGAYERAERIFTEIIEPEIPMVLDHVSRGKIVAGLATEFELGPPDDGVSAKSAAAPDGYGPQHELPSGF